MHSEFEQHAAALARNIVETDALSVEETDAEILRRKEQGDFLLGLTAIASET